MASVIQKLKVLTSNKRIRNLHVGPNNQLILFMYFHGERASIDGSAISFNVKNEVDPCFKHPFSEYDLVIREHHISLSGISSSAVLWTTATSVCTGYPLRAFENDKTLGAYEHKGCWRYK